jgi:hypothetical protein
MRSLAVRCGAVALALVLAGGTAHQASALMGAAHDRGSRITIPATTQFTVQLDRAISANMADGKGFTVTFSEPVQINGMLVIPAGASGAGLVSVDAHIQQIELNSVFVNGRSYRIITSPITLNPKSPLRAGKKLTFGLVFALNLQ